jgi:hypothetical protein
MKIVNKYSKNGILYAKWDNEVYTKSFLKDGEFIKQSSSAEEFEFHMSKLKRFLDWLCEN